jgi:hypothetical protein
MMFSLKGKQQPLDARPQVHDARSLVDVAIGGFKGIHIEAQFEVGQPQTERLAVSRLSAAFPLFSDVMQDNVNEFSPDIA